MKCYISKPIFQSIEQHLCNSLLLDLRSNGRYPYRVRAVSTAPLEILENFDQHNEYCLDRAFSSAGEYVGTVAVVSQLKPEIECRSRPCLRACCQQVCSRIFTNEKREVFDKINT